MKILRALRNVRYCNGILEKGEIVFVTEENRIVQGPFMNKTLQGFDCEFVNVTELNQELLQRREEVAELMDYKKRMEESWLGRQVQVFEKKMLIMEDSQAKRDREWQKLLDAEREEKELLLKTIENEAAAQKPALLPRKVAEAIDKIREQDTRWGRFSAFSLLDKVNVALRRSVHCPRIVSLIADWVYEDQSRRDTLVKALVNGYTVEPELSEDDKIVARYKECMDSGRQLEAQAIRQCVMVMGSYQMVHRLDVVDGDMPF